MKISRLSVSLLLVGVLVFTGQSCGGKTSTDAGGVYYSDDLAETWIPKIFVSQDAKATTTLAPINGLKLRVDPKNRDVMYMTTSENGVYKTFNRGEQWLQTGISTGLVRDLQVHPLNSEILYMTYGTSVLKSGDAGATWESIYTDPEGGEPTRIAIDWFNPQRLIIGTTQGIVLVSADEGINWTVTGDFEGPITDLLMSPTDSRVLYVTEFETSIHYSDNGGESWKDLFQRQLKDGETDKALILAQQTWDAFLSANPNFHQVESLFFDANDSERLLAVTAEGIFESRDRGFSWKFIQTLISKGASENKSIRALATVPGAPGLLYFSLNNEIHKSPDNGQTWKTIDNFPVNGIINALVPEYLTEEDTESNVMFAVLENPPKPKRTFFQVVPTE